MAAVFQKAVSLLTGTTNTKDVFTMPKNIRPLHKLTERELIQLESEIGSKLFGPIPSGHRREFFNLDKNTWIWYEEYKGADGKVHTTTTRYEIQAKSVLKAQDGAQYSYIEGEELQNLVLSVQMYYEQVMRRVYHRDPASGQKFSA